MIFVLQQRNYSLSNIASELAPGFYHAPRIEIPEVLWESLDRNDPAAVIDTVREWGTTLHLNEITLGMELIRYDGPGDFQLLLRDDLFENQGYDEKMLLGWHVDSNIAARMLLKYGKVGDLGSQVYGYHCDHTRQATPMHSHKRLQNDWTHFCAALRVSNLPEQADTWGCRNDEIEEVRLVANTTTAYVRALREVIGDPQAAPRFVQNVEEVFNKVDYDPAHLLPFLADMFVSMPRKSNVAWYGARPETLELFASVWQKLDFTGKILVDHPALQRDATTTVISHVPALEALAKADAFVFDFGGLPFALSDANAADRAIHELRASFYQVVHDERRRRSLHAPPRRVIALNAILNEYEGLVGTFVAASMTPFATHIRHGFVLPVQPWERTRRVLALYRARALMLATVLRAAVRRFGLLATARRAIDTVHRGGFSALRAKLRTLARAEAFGSMTGDKPPHLRPARPPSSAGSEVP
jgi:hypothetical protein